MENTREVGKRIITFVFITFGISSIFMYLVISADNIRAGGGLFAFGSMWSPGIIQEEPSRIRLEMGKNEIPAMELCRTCLLCALHPCFRLDYWPGRFCPRSGYRSDNDRAQGTYCRNSVRMYICSG